MTIVKEKKLELRLFCTWISVVTIILIISAFGCSQEPDFSPPQQQRDIEFPHNLQPEVWIAPQLEATALDGGSVDIIPSLVISKIPEYPQLPMTAGIQGIVVVDVVVDVTGGVKEAIIESSTMPLATQWSAVEAIKNYVFRP